MLARTDVVTDLPQNVLSLSVSRRVWSGVGVEVNEWRGAGPVIHRFRHETKTRLLALLEEVGGLCEPRLRENQPCSVGYTPRHMDLAPGGMELWGYGADARFVRDATLTFDFKVLRERLVAVISGEAISTPRLRFSDDRIFPLVKMLSDAVRDPDPSTELYGDGLITAIVARLFANFPKEDTGEKGLAPWQLRRVMEYLNAHLPERVDLASLASLAGLSSSHFSRAFKASTGVAPYRWQLDERIRRAQTLLVDADASLDQVAEVTGFADAVHFGRTFRKLTGATPAAWRRDRIT